MTQPSEAWNVSAVDYPVDGPMSERLAFFLRYAILAPSTHNTQPWRFGVSDTAIDVFADRSRSLNVIDPHHRQLIMSCGGALLNLRVAMRRFGYTGKVEYFPDPDDRDHLARFTLGLPIQPDARDRALFEAIPRRHTNRKPFALRPVSYRIANDLAAAVGREGAWLIRLDPESKRQAAALIEAADKAQFHDKAFRRELSQWLVSGLSGRSDGIPVASKGSIIDMPLIVRTFDIGGSIAARERELAKGSPMLVVLGTQYDEPLDWLRGGQGMQRMLLLAHTYGISASFLNQPLEVAEFREKFASLTGQRGFPQLVMRLGYGPDVQPTPRRTVDDVLIDGE